MSTFYLPFSSKILNVPVIIYPMKGLGDVLNRAQALSLENHLENLYEKESYLQSGTFHIVILWVDNSEVMSDIWIYRELESSETGYTVDCKTFRSQHPEIGDGITASDGLIMLGRETELEESMRKQGASIDDFINGQRPSLPGKLQPQVGFYKPRI